jgi:hypothetical protein
LPVVAYRIPGIPDYTKTSATSLSVMLAVLIFDAERLLSLRPRWFDLPVCLFCVAPFCSSVSNGLGSYDGLSESFSTIVIWGIPYLLGRAYFASLTAIKELATAIVLGGLAYIPFCWYEILMSPVLHYKVYGFSPKWTNTMRFGGWRPMVFMQDGLMLGVWMAMASLIGIWLWNSRSERSLGGYTIGQLVVPLVITTIWCRALGGLLLLAFGCGVLWWIRTFDSRWALCGLIAIAPFYLGTRATGVWDGQKAYDMIAMIDIDRASSFKTRLDNEQILVAKALERPIFGWGGWGRARVYDEWGNDISITDGQWIITLGNNGVLGLASLFTLLLLPGALVVWRWRILDASSPATAPLVALSVVVSLYAIDMLPNGMRNPVFMIACGAVTCVAATCSRAPFVHRTRPVLLGTPRKNEPPNLRRKSRERVGLGANGA